MAYSYIRYNGNGSTTNFTFPFNYISRDHVVVKVNDVSTSFTFLNDSTVTVSPAPASGTIVEIRRVTPKNTPIVNFTDGSVLLEADLDLLATFDLYIAQEAEDAVDDTIALGYDGVFDANNKRIKNVADPVNAQDAATKNYVDNKFAEDVAAVDADRVAAEAAASAAASSQTAAAGSASAAAASLAQFQSIYHGASATPPTTNVSTGDLWFDTSNNTMKVYNGTAWLQASVQGASREVKVATAGQTVFNVTAGYSVDQVDVYLNGVKLVNGTDFTAVDGQTVVLTTGATVGDTLEIVSLAGISIADANLVQRVSFVGDGSTTTFNTTHNLINRASVIINVNGVVQNTNAFNVASTNIIFNEAPTAGDEIDVTIFGVAPQSISVQADDVIYTPSGTGVVPTTVETKLREFISANDFAGVDPTGATDSYAGLMAAIAATPTGGTLLLNGIYKCSATLVINKAMTLQGCDSRLANVSTPTISRSYVHFINDTHGIEISNAIVTIRSTVIASSFFSPSSTKNGINIVDSNSNVLILQDSVIQSFNRGVNAAQTYYCKFVNSTITYCVEAIRLDYCYNAFLSGMSINATSYGITMVNGSSASIHGSSIESFTGYGIGLYDGSSVSCFGTYFEGFGGYTIMAATNASVTTIACHVYLSAGATRFVSVESGTATGVRIYSRNNRISYPTDATAVLVYGLVPGDATAYSDIAGDNWQSPIGANVTYYSGGAWFGLQGNHKIEYPASHPSYGKNLNTVPYGMTPAISGVSGTPNVGTVVSYYNAGYSGDDPIGLRSTAWGYNPYSAIYQNGRWEKVGLRMPNQADSTASTVAGIVTDFNSLLAKLRAAGVMI